MKAAIINKYGGPDVFHMEDVSDVLPKANEVKIQVYASSVNPVDYKTRSGSIFFMSGFKFPKILGSDFSGVITECGVEVKDYAPGDEVFGFTNAVKEGGAYGEYLCSVSTKIARKPTNLTFLEAGVTPLAASTAFQGLWYEGEMTEGMRVCITGATGGVGHFAVQMAKAANCHVTGICHSSNTELALQFGCDEVLPYDQISFKDMDDQRFDLIFDAVAKFGYFTCRHTMKRNGSYITTIPSITTLLKPLISYMYHGHKVRSFWANSNTTDLIRLTQLSEQGLLKPYIEQKNIFTLQDVSMAHALNETQKARGKIGVEIIPS